MSNHHQQNLINAVLQNAEETTSHPSQSQRILLRFAQKLAAKRKYSDVIRVYRYLQQQSPKNLNYMVAIARVHNIEGKTTQAQKLYQKVLQTSPQHFYANIELAKIYESEQKQHEAQKLYENVIKFHPKNPYAYKKLAQIYSQNEKTQKKAAEMNTKGQELEQKQQQKKTQPAPTIPKIPNPNDMLPKLPKIPTPQDFYPKLPGRK